MKQHYDYCILGAGLAGLSVAKSLIEHKDNCSILILDPNGIAGGASGSPIGLINPATGRYANQTWKAESSIKAAKKNLDDVTTTTKKKFFKKSGVIRPALEKKIAERMQENLDNTKWPDNWCSWVDENEMRTRFPGLNYTEGGIWVNEGYTVSIPNYLKALAEYLQDSNIDIVEHQKFELKHKQSNWEISVADSISPFQANTLIVTAGIKTKEFDFFKDLPLIPVKGQISVYECENQFPYEEAVSALGYFASLDGKTFIAGSTYEHKFTHENTDEFGIEYISNRLFRVMPKLKGNVKLINQWSGVRASTPDRMPIIGYHPKFENCFVFAGLGSKGLLYSGYLGGKIGAHYGLGDDIPAKVSIDRFL